MSITLGCLHVHVSITLTQLATFLQQSPHIHVSITLGYVRTCVHYPRMFTCTCVHYPHTTGHISATKPSHTCVHYPWICTCVHYPHTTGHISATKPSHTCVHYPQVYSSALVNKANVLVGLQEVDKCLDCFTQALEVDPGCADVYIHRAKVWCHIW